jgi:ribosomal protein S18 acetylase RimI-like enzyme
VSAPQLTIRPATAEDGAALADIDRRTWSPVVTPADRWPADRPFFSVGLDPADVLVAEVGGVVAGYVKLGPATPLPSNRHVLEVQGLAVAPQAQRRGIGRELMKAAIDEARRRGARRLTLRVLAINPGARALYESLGFQVEGILHGEFRLDGEYVDDYLMALQIGPPGGARSTAG